MSAPAGTAGIEQQLERRRAAVAERWADLETVVLIGAGDPIHRPGRDDLTYPFQAHSEYFYLTDRNESGGVLAFDPDDGWVDFLAPVTVADRLWSGAQPQDPKQRTTLDLTGWLQTRTSHRNIWLGIPRSGEQPLEHVAEEHRFALAAVRRIKDDVELERMRAAQQATRAAFARVVPLIQQGASERDIQIELEAEAFRHGAEAMAYDTIIGGGPNSAVLHFLPTARTFNEGELVLIDAGAQYLGYASDITRTYPVGGTLTPFHKDLHTLVHLAERDAIEHCRPGVEWRDIHRVAARTIAAGLVGLQILKGDPEELIDSGAVWLFFPHGVGHLVGLGVRDAGGTPLPERRDDPKPYPNLRIDLPLEPGMVVTVEPGVYFVPAILNDPENREHHASAVNWDVVDRFLTAGGVRIEDNVLITPDGHDVITADVPVLA